eukprot:TRINITY_DN15752_c0_g1_i2.p1 TRINITY_DN15752_c0_g1~~TRINITY_DN15752_c0_g1_i2.p1  ORF type:complete len:450 (-),score=82.09 TRINITY_DN15752_c0_g1_i2:122-1471(-)
MGAGCAECGKAVFEGFCPGCASQALLSAHPKDESCLQLFQATQLLLDADFPTAAALAAEVQHPCWSSLQHAMASFPAGSPAVQHPLRVCVLSCALGALAAGAAAEWPKAIQLLDRALLVSVGTDAAVCPSVSQLQQLAHCCVQQLEHVDVARPRPAKRRRPSSSKTVGVDASRIRELQQHGRGVHVARGIDEASFRAEHFGKHPVLIQSAMNDWPALCKWKGLDYMKRAAGARTVPLEVGSQHGGGNHQQRLVLLRDYLDQCFSGEEHLDAAGADGLVSVSQVVPVTAAKCAGYLAQHRLFDQVPALKQDIRIPEYATGTACSSGGEVTSNAWYGPAGTVTPLHFDHHHGLLAQVLGEKLVILHPAKHTSSLYPCEGVSNASGVDPTDLEGASKWPLYAEVRPERLHVLLRPGEMLYIPEGYWHYVEAITPSYSAVSYTHLTLPTKRIV